MLGPSLDPVLRPTFAALGLFAAVGLALACSETDSTPGGAVGGAATGGTVGSGGTPGGGVNTGGTTPSTGGTVATGGAPSTGGVSASGAPGSGGATTGGSSSGGGGASGGKAGGSSGGAPLAGTAGATGGSAPIESDCSNGKVDGDEMGVDCGGSTCPACPTYRVDPPLEMNPNARSACEANGTGFMCAQAMVMSPQMIQAAKDDFGGTEPPFVYGVVGHDPDPSGVDAPSSNYASTCCQCYQLVFKGPRDSMVSVPLPKPMVVQAFNTYAGGPTAFDVYMAVGGHGNFNGCTANGRQYSAYPDTGGDWSGGVRATRYSQCGSMNGFNESSIGSQSCQAHIEAECNKIQAPELVQSISRKSCIETNRIDTHYHMNWNVVVKRIECPENLTRVTGCRLSDQGLPEADPAVDTVAEAMAAGFRDSDYHTTTMQDCCRPTCAWPDNTTNTLDPYGLFYSCNAEGEPYTQ